MEIMVAGIKRGLKVSEIFLSVQGESSYVGLPCVFIRLAGCSLNCRWCDTRYARRGGKWMTLSQISRRIWSYRIPLVEVTGGEPLEQDGTIRLLTDLLKDGYRVLLETNGARDVSRVPKAVVKVLDVKCPSSGREKENLWSNLDHLTDDDEVKFVIGGSKDYRFAKRVIRRFKLAGKRLLFSPLYGRLEPRCLTEWVLRDRLPVRIQVQLHKYLWGPAVRGC
jgi:7-carboxy-7-deazaguanine synthase